MHTITFCILTIKILEILKNNLPFTKYTNFITSCFYEFEYMRVLQIVYMNLNTWRKCTLK